MALRRSVRQSPFGTSRSSRFQQTSRRSQLQRKRIMAERRIPRTISLGIENKFLDTGASALAMVAPTDCTGGELQPEFGCTGCLSAPAQGDGESERDGRKIVVTSCFVSGCVGYALSGDNNDVLMTPTIFVALVMDTQTNATTVNSEDVFSNPNDTSLVNTYPLRNMSNTSRFRVLARKVIGPSFSLANTDGTNTTSVDANDKAFTLSWKGQMVVNFNNTGTTADVSRVVNNSLHLVAFATAVTNVVVPNMNYNCRIRFKG